MTAADGYAREVAEFLDVWDAAPAHRTGYRDVISSQKTGEDGRKLRAGALRGLLAEVKRLHEAHASLAAAFDGVCGERDQRARETEETAEKLAEMTRCRDAALRLAEREDTEIEFDLDGNLRDGLVGIAEWEHRGEPDQAPDWLIDAIVPIVRPELARLTETLNAERVAHWNTRKELSGALERPTHPAFERLRTERDQANEKLAAATRTVARLAETRMPGAECCAHCGKPRNGLGEIGGVKVCHTGTNPAQFDPIDCYRLVTVYGEPLGARIGEPTATDDANPDVCRDCYGRGDDFEGGTCPHCHGTGAPS